MDVSMLKEWNAASSIEQIVDFFDGLCNTYRHANADERKAIREAIKHNHNIYSALLYDSIAAVGNGPYLAILAETKRLKDYASYLDAALTVVSITGGFGDSRDTLLWLDRLWDDAEEHGVNPRPNFESAANLSDTTENRLSMFGGSTKGMILQCVCYSPNTGKLRAEREMPESGAQARLADKKTKRKRWWKLW